MMVVTRFRPPKRRYIVLLGILAAGLIALIPVALAQVNHGKSAQGWRAPTKLEYARIQRSLTAWACQQNPGCKIAVPQSRVHIANAPFGHYGVIYATATVELNPNGQDPQGDTTLLYRHGPAAANGYHDRLPGSPAWWVPAGSPYIDGAPFTTLEKFSPAICHYAKTKLQGDPNGC
jgi:hypothetical protein